MRTNVLYLVLYLVGYPCLFCFLVVVEILCKSDEQSQARLNYVTIKPNFGEIWSLIMKKTIARNIVS